MKQPMNRPLSRTLLLPALAALLIIGSASAQDAPKTPAAVYPKTDARPGSRDLNSFDLDFKGGRPRDLVTAIEKATSHTLNVLIPEEFANTQIPALKMKNVYLPELFAALELASRKQETVKIGTEYQRFGSSYGFRQAGGNNVINDDTIWYFHAERPNIPPAVKACRFYSLAPYLEQ